MPNFGAGDVPALLSTLGVDVTFGATTVKGLVDRAGSRLLDGGGTPAAVIGTAIEVTIQTASLPGLTTGSLIVVDGVNYAVSSTEAIDDGELTVLTVRNR